MSIKNVSIIGRGDFGQLLKNLCPKDVSCTTYGSKDTAANIQTIGASDVVILSIPLASYPNVLEQLAPVLKPDTLLIDVCSVKIEPAKLIHQFLPNHQNLLITHPLFGPLSYNNGNQGKNQLTLVITESVGKKAKIVEEYCAKKLKLRALHMSDQEHDKRMAEIHALTFFIARGLTKLNLHSEPFMTASFQSLLDLVALDASQTEALFETVQNGNPFASQERQQFLEVLGQVNSSLGRPNNIVE